MNVERQRRTIAIVDDDTRFLVSMENLFQSAGYEVRTFSSAGSLLEAGLSGFACLVTDIGMPGMDGFELHDIAMKQRPDLPVFLITGRHEIGDQQRANAKNIRGFLRKPCDGAALLKAVGDALAA